MVVKSASLFFWELSKGIVVGCFESLDEVQITQFILISPREFLLGVKEDMITIVPVLLHFLLYEVYLTTPWVGVAVVALAGYGVYFYGFAQPAAAVVAPGLPTSSQLSVTNIKVDFVIKTHWV